MKGRKMRIESGGMVKQRVKPKGGTMKRIVLGLLLVMGMAAVSHALTTDSVVLTVTPVFNMSINISSTSYTFGATAVLRTSISICVGAIMNDGNVTAGWQKATDGAHSASTSNDWSLITTGTPFTNQFRLLAITTGVGKSPNFCGGGAPAASCLNGNHQGLMSVDDTATFSDLVEGGTASPVHSTGETRELWVSLMMPYSVTSGDEQTVTLSVRAVVK